jgi:hypothetical protein
MVLTEILIYNYFFHKTYHPANATLLRQHIQHKGKHNEGIEQFDSEIKGC